MNLKLDNGKELKQKQDKLYTLTDALKPILICQRLSGINRFSLNNNPEKCVTWKTRIHSLAILCVTIVSFYYFQTFSFMDPKSCYLQKSINIVVLIKIVITILTVSLCKRPESVQIYNMFTEIDAKLRLSHSGEFNKSRRRSYAFMVMSIVCSYSAIYIYDIFASYLFARADQLYIFFGCVMHDLDILTFLALTKEIRIRIALINRNILGNVLNEFDECSCDGGKSKMKNILDCLKPNVRVCYNKLMNPDLNNLCCVCFMMEKIIRICACINRLYNMQLLQSFASKFFYVLLLIETMIDLDGSRDYLDMTFVIYVALFVLLQLGLIQWVCVVCEKVTEEANKTTAILNKILVDCDVDKRSRRQTKVMVKLLESRKPSFTVYGMFTLNLGLILSFISLTTTYVIVLMQYTSMHAGNTKS